MRTFSVAIIMMAAQCLLSTQVMATSVWTNSVGNGQWNTAVNWSNGVPVTTGSGDTAIFTASTAGRAISLTGTAPKNCRFIFKAGAGSYSFSGATVDNGASSLPFTTELGMDGNQTFSSLKIGQDPQWLLNGSGDVTISSIFCSTGWTASQVNKATFNVSHADAVLTLGGFAQGKAFNPFTKKGAGKLVFTGTVDWPYGLNGSTFVQTKFRVEAGSFDISAATLKLEDNAAGIALKSGQTYTIIDYSGATPVGNPMFTAIQGLPAGWEVVNMQPSGNMIVLREKPRGMVVLVR